MGFMRLSNKQFVFTPLFMGCSRHPSPVQQLLQTPGLMGTIVKSGRLCVPRHALAFQATHTICRQRLICTPAATPWVYAPSSR